MLVLPPVRLCAVGGDGGGLEDRSAGVLLCSEVKSRRWLLGAACWLRLGLASVPGLHRILLSH